MIGEHVLRRLASPNNKFFVFPILVNGSSTSFGIVYKLGGFGGGPPILCTNCAELEPATLIVSIENKQFLVKGSRTSSARWSKFGISSEVLLFGPFGWSGTTRCSTKSNGMNPR